MNENHGKLCPSPEWAEYLHSEVLPADSAGSFTMLHHLPTAALQNQLLAELLRVLRPGGVLIGSGSLASIELHHFHEGDVYNPIKPAVLLTRLQTLGYELITISVGCAMTFVAHLRATQAESNIRPVMGDRRRVPGGGSRSSNS